MGLHHRRRQPFNAVRRDTRLTRWLVGVGRRSGGRPADGVRADHHVHEAGRQVSEPWFGPAPDNSSGYIGIQTHTGKVAFRRIRLQPK